MTVAEPGSKQRARGGRSWILVCAGEASGDQLAAPVIEELQAREPRLRFFGAGGDCLAATGMELRHQSSALAVTGLSEVLSRQGSILRLLADLRLQIRRRRPRLALLVDYPGVNLHLARWLKHERIPVLYLVAPQCWAWLGFRTYLMQRRIDRLAVTLPFEEEWFTARGVNARFVGHPLLDLFQPVPRTEALARLGLGRRPILALLPGSRENEIARHLPILVQGLSLLARDVDPLLVVRPGQISRLCLRLAPHLPQAPAPLALGAADLALCASGTATLELALANVPGVVFYRLSPLSYQVARRLVKLSQISLPNIILGEPLLPELIQDQMTPPALAYAARNLLDGRQGVRIKNGLARVRKKLGTPGYAQRVVDLAQELLG